MKRQENTPIKSPSLSGEGLGVGLHRRSEYKRAIAHFTAFIEQGFGEVMLFQSLVLFIFAGMKTLFFLLILGPFITTAQKHDYVWITGDDNSLTDPKRGGTTIDFNVVPRSVQYHYRPMNMFLSNANLADTSGNLLFYSNGCAIAGADDGVITNGDDLNPGYLHDLWCESWNDGYAAGYPSMVALPQPETDSVFYLFHERSEYVSSPKEDVYNNQLLYSRIWRSPSKGRMEVTDKNIEVINDSLATGELSAVKHGNGKDWWVVLPRRNSNQFYVFLFTMVRKEIGSADLN